MVSLAFTSAIPLGRTTLIQPSLSTQSKTPLKHVPKTASSVQMKVDDYMASSVRRQYKQYGVPNGEYTTQCTEGTTRGAAEDKRVNALAAAFRARQASTQARYADLFNTRRLAVVGAKGCHHEEKQMCDLPMTAYACVMGRAEAFMACNRYRNDTAADAQYMNKSVERQCRMADGGADAVGGGEFGVGCVEGSTKGQAETMRVNALASKYRAKQMPQIMKERSRYNSSLMAIHSHGNGCAYEEKLFMDYPMAAGAMKRCTGVYAAGASGAAGFGGPAEGRKIQPLAVQLQGPNASVIWPSFERRPAVQRKRAPWDPPAVKNYAPMSEAALQAGIQAQSRPYRSQPGAERWSPGWQPASKALKSYI